MSFRKQHDTIRQKILELAAKYPAVVTDYRKLIQYFWFYMDHMERFVPLEVLENLTQPESITRAFRKLVEDGEIVVPVDVKGERSKQEKLFRDHYRK